VAPVTNTARMRFIWTFVSQAGARPYVIPPDQPLRFNIGLYMDRNLGFEAGYFTLRWDVYNNENSERFGWTEQFWASDFRHPTDYVWRQLDWQQATHCTRGGRGLYFFRPFIQKTFIPPGGGFVGGAHFAVAPEDHYFFIE
jgi:hypothetical protein